MKEIKFSSISFNEIGIDGLEYHEYKWDKETGILTHHIEGIEFENFKGVEARKKIRSVIGTERKKKVKEFIQEKILGDTSSQLKLF